MTAQCVDYTRCNIRQRHNNYPKRISTPNGNHSMLAWDTTRTETERYLNILTGFSEVYFASALHVQGKGRVDLGIDGKISKQQNTHFLQGSRGSGSRSVTEYISHTCLLRKVLPVLGALSFNEGPVLPKEVKRTAGETEMYNTDSLLQHCCCCEYQLAIIFQ